MSRRSPLSKPCVPWVLIKTRNIMQRRSHCMSIIMIEWPRLDHDPSVPFTHPYRRCHITLEGIQAMTRWMGRASCMATTMTTIPCRWRPMIACSIPQWLPKPTIVRHDMVSTSTSHRLCGTREQMTLCYVEKGQICTPRHSCFNTLVIKRDKGADHQSDDRHHRHRHHHHHHCRHRRHHGLVGNPTLRDGRLDDNATRQNGLQVPLGASRLGANLHIATRDDLLCCEIDTGDWNWRLELAIGTGDWNWRLGLEIGTGDWNWRLELEIGTGDWNWRLELEIGTGDWNWRLELAIGTGQAQIHANKYHSNPWRAIRVLHVLRRTVRVCCFANQIA
jgi:hypothetical protein